MIFSLWEKKICTEKKFRSLKAFEELFCITIEAFTMIEFDRKLNKIKSFDVHEHLSLQFHLNLHVPWVMTINFWKLFLSKGAKDMRQFLSQLKNKSKLIERKSKWHNACTWVWHQKPFRRRKFSPNYPVASHNKF